MDNSNRKMIEQDTHRLAQSHGFKLSVNLDTKDSHVFTDSLGTMVTAGWSDGDLGAELTDIPMNKESVDDWLNLYCENVLHCTANDVTWLPFSLVTKENGAVEYSVNDLNDGWIAGSNGGIIFITKEQARQYFKTKNLTNDMIKEIEDAFVTQLFNIAALKKGEVHRISVEVAQKELSGSVDEIQNSCGGIFKMYEAADEVADEILNNTFRRIEAAENAVSVTFKMDKDIDNYGYLPAYITDQLKGNLLFTPAVSHTQLYRNNTFSISIALNTIPPFLKLCADTDKDLLAVFYSNISKLGEIPTFKAMSLHEVHTTISKNNGYTDWSPMMVSALVAALTDSIKDIHFINAKLFSDKSTPELQIAKFLEANCHNNVKNKLISSILKQTGGATAFIEKKIQFDHRDRAEGLVGIATIEQKMDFFYSNKEAVILYGRSKAKELGFLSFIELIEEGMSKYGYNMDDISDALNSAPDSHKEATKNSLSIVTWITKWTVNQLHEELLRFSYS